MKSWLAAGALVAICAPVVFGYSSRHVELEKLARKFAYTGGRLAKPAPGTSTPDTRDEDSMSMQGDAAFRKELKDAGYELLDSIDDKRDSGMQAMVVRDDQGQTFVVFRGTEPGADMHYSLPPDVTADFEHSGNVGNSQYQPFADKLAAWAARYPDSYVTGHSLGAALAEHYIAEHPEAVKEAALFNVPAISYDLANKAAQSPNLPPCSIYVGMGDPVSELGGSSHIPCRIIEVSDPDLPSVGYWIPAHSFTMLDSRNSSKELDYAAYEQRRRNDYEEVRIAVAAMGSLSTAGKVIATAVIVGAPPKPSSPSAAMVAVAQQQLQDGGAHPNRKIPRASGPMTSEEQAIKDKIDALRQRLEDLALRINTVRGASVEQAQSLDSARQRFRKLMATLNQRLVPACERARNATGISRADVDRIEQQSDEVESLLKSGQALLDRCADTKALEQATQGFQRATTLANGIEEAGKEAEARASMQSELATLAEARQLQNQLHQQQSTVPNKDDLATLRTDVDAFNNDLTAQKGSLRARLQDFRYAFRTNGPAAGARLFQLDSDLASVHLIDEPMLAAATESRTQLLLTVNNGLGGELSDADTVLKDLAECVNGNYGLSPQFADAIDTARTLSGLAMTKLGPPYERALTACRARLGTSPVTSRHGPAPFDESGPITPPVYLLETVHPGGDLHYGVYIKLPVQANGVFTVYDTYGLPWRYPGEYSGPYGDRRALCSVLRGYGQKSVDYSNGQDSIQCATDGPQTAPVNPLRSGASANPPAPAPATVSSLPAWASGTSTSNAPSPLAAIPDPWNDARVQGSIDEWIQTAVPPSNTPGIVMRYNEWAQPLSQGAISTGHPDHPADWTRYRYLWETRAKWTSTKLCTLGEFVERRVAGKPLDGCTVSAPPAISRLDLARQQLAHTTQEQVQKQPPLPPSPRPTPPPNPPAPGTPSVVTLPAGESKRVEASALLGEWSCDGTTKGSGAVGLSRMALGDAPADTLTLRIRETNGAYRIWAGTAVVEAPAEFAAAVTGNAIRAENRGHRDDWIKAGGYDFEAFYDFHLQGQNLAGTHRYHDNSSSGLDFASNYRCTKSAGSKK
jgi:pimeloyl-ACP methyl ester carboxylesterase